MVTERIEIARLGSHPTHIGQEDIRLLQHLSDDMPWCSSYRVLLARGHSNEESYLQSKYLRLAATYSGDKAILFQLMTQEEFPGHIKSEQNRTEPVKTKVNIPIEEVLSEQESLEEISSDLPAVLVEKEFPIENESVKDTSELLDAILEIPK